MSDSQLLVIQLVNWPTLEGKESLWISPRPRQSPRHCCSNVLVLVQAGTSDLRRRVIGSFPAHSTRTVDVFEEWLVEMEEGIAKLK